MRYIFFILSILISQISNAQMVTQPGLGDYQMSGRNLPDSVLYILGTDTLDGSAKQGLGKFLTAESLRGFFKDTDWLKYRTGTIPNNTDTMYHVGVATVGDDSVYLSTNVLSGVLNVVGRLDLRLGEVGDYNIAIGREAGRSAQTGNLNIAIGNQALDAVTTGSSNVAMGGTAGTGITTGSRNFALGGASLASNVTGSDNSALGNSALNSYTGSQNTAIGSSALSSLETGAGNVAIGYQAGLGEISGTNNTFIGSQTGSTTEGDHNVFIGYQSGRLNEGSSNIFIGKESGENETGSELLYIDPSNGIPLIKGDFAADTLRINGDLSIRDAVSGASTDSVLVWTPSNGRVKMRNAAAFGGSGATDLSIAQSGATQVIQSSTGTDVGVRNLYGLLITEGATDTLHLAVDSSKLATQFDISGFGTMSNWLLAASGTGGTETITNGETFTVTGAGINVATRSTNNVTITGTEVDGSTTNEIQDITLTGTNPYVLDLSSDATDVTFEGAGIITLSEGTPNTLTITGTEVDGSTTNEIQDITLSGTTTVTFDLSSDATDATITGAGIAAISRSGNAITVTATEVDGSITNELIDIYEDNSPETSDVTSIDYGEGLDNDPVGSQSNLNLDFSEFQIDGTAEGTEYVIIHDVDTTAGHQNQRRLVSSFGGADGNGIFDAGNDGGTVPTDMDIVITDHIDFDLGALYIDAASGEVGVGTQSPDAAFEVETNGAVELLLNDASGLVEQNTKSNVGGTGNTYKLLVQNTDADLTTNYPMGSIAFVKGASTAYGGTIAMGVGYNATLEDNVFTLGSRESGATDGYVAVNGGLRYKWRTDATTAATFNTGDYGITMTTTGAKTATVPDATSTLVGQTFFIFNSGTSGDITISITGGSGDTILGDVTVAINESVTITCPETGVWIGN